MPQKQQLDTKKASKKRNFSSFEYGEAFKQLGITELTPWQLQAEPAVPSEFFHQRLARLDYFSLTGYEESKKLLIDAICEEAIQGFRRLKIWKGAGLASNLLTGNPDYLIAERKAYLEAPFLCVVEAKKDDFEKGLAQCLVEMQVCQWCNRQINRDFDIFGIVTNGQTWQFYQLTTKTVVYETLPYSINDIGAILGILRHLFSLCDAHLADYTT